MIMLPLMQMTFALQSGRVIQTYGSIANYNQIVVNIFPDNVVNINKFSPGFQLTYGALTEFPNSQEDQNLAKAANFKLIRIFDYQLQPCKSWNDQTQTGSFDWGKTDALIKRIFEIGAEPMIDLIHCGYGPVFQLPPGMGLNSSTGLPNPESYAAYATEWVKHFKALNLPVKYYEIINEVQFYIFNGPWTWTTASETRTANYMHLYNVASARMRQENSDLALSFDFVTHKNVLDYWLAHGGAEIDSLNFHKYDSDRLTQYTDQQVFSRAESEYFGTWPLGRSVTASQQVYYSARGRSLPIINSESNLNSYCATGSDPRIVQMAGAVWTALVLRMDILNGINYNIYFTWDAGLNYEQSKPEGGNGFGLINSDNHQPWYPYYVHEIIGSNLAVGDRVFETTTNSQNIRSLAWEHQGKMTLLLISENDSPQQVLLQGLTGQLQLYKLDNTIPWNDPNVQKEIVSSTNPLTLQGYTVALFQEI